MAVQQIMRMQPTAEAERIQHEDLAAKYALWAGVSFLLLFGVLGLIASVKFVIPDLFYGFNWLSWPRIRPVHVQGMIFGWALPIFMSMFYYMVPRLTGTKLWSEKLGIATTAVWSIGVLIMILGVLNPMDSTNPWIMTKGKEYEEWPVLSSIFIVAAWLMLTVNIYQTFLRRTYKQMYVALWYTMGCIMWTSFVYVIGNWPSQLLPANALMGLNDANVNWFYGHSVVGLIATPAALATAYYFLPKAANAPLYSHKLSLIGFWTLGSIYIWNGAHHMIYGPIPYWLQTVATIFSFLLFVPVLSAVTNFFGTIRGEWHQLRTNVPLKFIVAGTIFYLLVSTQGSFQALRALNAVTHFTDWVIGHSHMAMFGFVTFYAFAGCYYAVPRMYKRRLYSEGMADWHFWLSFIGFILFSTALWIGGFNQGMEWNNPSIPFISTVKDMMPFWHARAGGAALMVTGLFLFAFNLYKTATASPSIDGDGGGQGLDEASSRTPSTLTAAG